MLNLPCDVNEETYYIPLAVLFPLHGEDVVISAEEEALPSAEEIIPCYLDAKPDLQRPPKVMTKKFQSTMMARRLVDFKTKFGLPNHVELVTAGNDEVHICRPG